VCIAARNETHALARCLDYVLKSDYPKIEILVLDDSSDDDTSLIIKSYASAGVRFVAGKPLPEGWLGKNHAYQTLIEEASGDTIVFLDVDTTIQTSTISQLVRQMHVNQKSMVSVLPRREDIYHASALLGTFRYYWELLLASRVSPPASSALWVVDRKKLAEAGVGLPHYGLSVRPERHLARQFQRQKDYYYLIGSAQLGVAYEKRLSSQQETAIRLYYPMSGRSPVKWAGGLVFLILLLVPFPALAIWVWTPLVPQLSLVCILMTTIAFGAYARAAYAKPWGQLRAALWPILLIQEVILLAISYLRYKTGTVTWKGRLITAQPVNNNALNMNE
jgi:glycosyltransferase involved in cell wall biosynthesis